MKTKSKMMAMGAAIAAVLAGASVRAAVIAEYRFGTNVNATSTDTNVTASAVTGGTGMVISRVTSITPNYPNAPFATAAKGATTTAGQNYFQIVVTAVPGYELDLSELSMNLSAGGGTAGQRSITFRTSVDGLNEADPVFANVSLTALRPVTGVPYVYSTYTYDLSAAKYQNLSSITVRGYVSTPTINQNIDVDDIVLSGEAAVVPEPGAAVGLVMAGAALMRRRQ